MTRAEEQTVHIMNTSESHLVPAERWPAPDIPTAILIDFVRSAVRICTHITPQIQDNRAQALSAKAYMIETRANQEHGIEKYDLHTIEELYAWCNHTLRAWIGEQCHDLADKPACASTARCLIALDDLLQKYMNDRNHEDNPQ